jgi:hypothetical protein
LKSRLWLNVALLAVVGAIALFVYLRPRHDSADHRLSAITPGEARKITIERGAAPAIVFERGDRGWRLTAPFAARADGVRIAAVLDVLGATSNEMLPAQGLARYDLDPPQVRLTINDQVFTFGAVNALAQAQYVATGGSVYLIALNYGQALPASAYDVAARDIFAPAETPVGFEFKDFRVALDEGLWKLTPPADVGADDIARWVSAWRYANALAVLPSSGRTPLATVSIALKDGSAIRLSVLERTPRIIVRRDGDPFEMQLAGSAGATLLAPPSAAH